MRLAINGRYLTRPMTGVERFGHELVTALAARGDISLRYLAPVSADLVTRPPGGCQLVRAGRGSGQAWEQLSLPRLVADDEWLYSPCNLGPIARARQIVTIHDAQIYLTPESYSHAFRGWYRLLLPVIGRRARVITTDSRFSRSMLERYGVVPPGKAHVVYGGCDHVLRIAPSADALARFGLADRSFLLAIGSLSPHKNIATLVAAMEAADPGMPLIVAGGGNSAVFRAAGLRDGPNVRFLGRIDDADLRALYDGARALLFPSFFEGFGLPPLEAMACGCPVVASDRGSIAEVCGDAAIYADPDDLAAWGAAIRRVAKDDSLTRDLTAKGHIRAATFTWRRSAEALIASIEAVS